MSHRVRILSNPVLPFHKTIATTAIVVHPVLGNLTIPDTYSSVTLQIRAQFLSDSDGLYIPVRNR